MENRRYDFKRFKVQEVQYMNRSSRENNRKAQKIQEKQPKLKDTSFQTEGHKDYPQKL